MEHRLRGGGAQGYQAACLVTLSPTTGAWSLTLHASTLKGPRNCLSWPIIFFLLPFPSFHARIRRSHTTRCAERDRTIEEKESLRSGLAFLNTRTPKKKKKKQRGRGSGGRNTTKSGQYSNWGFFKSPQTDAVVLSVIYIYIFFPLKDSLEIYLINFTHHPRSPPPPLTAVTSTRDHLVRKRVYG